MFKKSLALRHVGETQASFIQGQVVTEAFYENSMEILSTVVGWTSISGHTVQKSGAKNTKLIRCGQKCLTT